MVGAEQGDVGLFGQAQQDQAQPQRLLRREVPGHLRGVVAANLPRLLRSVEVRQVEHRHRYLHDGVYDLYRSTVLADLEGGAQHLVAAHHIGEEGGQQVRVELALDPERASDDVGPADPFDRPLPLLRKPQRRGSRPVARRDPLPAARPLLGQEHGQPLFEQLPPVRGQGGKSAAQVGHAPSPSWRPGVDTVSGQAMRYAAGTLSRESGTPAC